MTENLSNRIVSSWNHRILYLMLLSYYMLSLISTQKGVKVHRRQKSCGL